jgi:hypothetical protein
MQSSIVSASQQSSNSKMFSPGSSSSSVCHRRPPPPPHELDYNASWYRDALGQAGVTDAALAALMRGESVTAAAQSSERLAFYLQEEVEETTCTADELEVLEQYRILAIHEARQRVNQNLGYDLTGGGASAEQRKLPSSVAAATDGCAPVADDLPDINVPFPLLPGDPVISEPATIRVRPVTGSSAVDDERDGKFVLKPCVPMPVSPVAEPSPPEESPPTGPELVTGQLHPSGGLPAGDNVMTTRCWGCKVTLRVDSVTATLVRCPDCETISPASSTRH